MNNRFADSPEPPYYAVIFSGLLSENDKGYAKMGEKMFELALAQPGCIGAESTKDTDGFGITVSYWKDEESISAWKQNAQHLVAQRMGNEQWYEHFEIRVAKVERAYSGPRND